MHADDRLDWVALSLIPGLSSERLRLLLSRFGTPDRIFATPPSALATVVQEALAHAISARRFDGAAVETTARWLEDPVNHIITLADPAYPRCLLEIADPPPLLYLKGDPAWLGRPGFAIVGSRHATVQGRRDAMAFAEALSRAGLCIVSGLAVGVDAAAHEGGLAGGGGSIAVVGTGLDIVYPAANRALAHRLAQEGLLLSEFPLGTPPRAQHFPRRNRLISGLSRGVLVVEAAPRSGSLITARLAAEQGREVFAVPGSIHSPLSKGCHRLIKEGAKLVETAQDVVDELGVGASAAFPESATQRAVSQEAERCLRALGHAPLGLDGLVARTGLTPERLSSILLELELAGRVAVLPGGLYQAIF
ncbi:DNA-processing protein DprA [Thiobacter aerophilum]|uniref:DNA-processing protein DprA n=1 Tax=Thiobacter aerophilum TaxID=3121275 RepID=A0ABV0EFB4_9BURK